MKVTIKNENESSEIKYPCLMQTSEGSIIFFYEEDCGTVIKHTEYKAGSYHTDWAMRLFTPFTGTVELSND